MSVKHLSWAWNKKLGDPTTKLILMKLADGADESNRSWYSHQTLADKCETSVSTVRRHLRLLKEKNFISIIPRHNENGQTSNFYEINIDTPVQNEQPPLVTSEHPPCSSMTTPPVHSYEQRPIKDPLIEPNITKKFSEEELKAITKNPNILKEKNYKTTLSTRPEDMLFDEWWKLIPFEANAHVSKFAYKRALRKVDHKTLCEKAKAYYDYQIKIDKKPTYWLRPHNWLDGENWLVDAENQDKKPSETGLKKADPEYFGMYHLWKKRVQSWMADGSWLKTWGDDPEKNTTDVPIEILKELQVGKYRQCNNTKVS